MKKMCPNIEIKPYPINNFDDADSQLLFHVTVSQKKIKMLFLVGVGQSNNKRLYEVIRCENICLHGLEEKDKYLENCNEPNKISADPTIVNEIFKSSLETYGIKLIKVNFHSFNYFESYLENNGFYFEDNTKYNELKDKINSKCIKMMKYKNFKEY